MTNTDFERAFGTAPQGFEDAIRRALKEDKGRSVMRTSRRALLIAALVAVLAFSAAFAATRGFGLLDMLSQRFQMPDAAVELVQTPVPQQDGALSRIDATLEQAISDGEKVYYTVRIAPKPGEKLLLMDDMDESPGARVNQSDDSDPTTFRQLAEREGRSLLVAYPYIGWTGDYKTYRSEMLGAERDGDAVVYARAVDCLPDDDGKVRLSVMVKAYDPDAETQNKESIILTATLENTGELKAYRWKDPAKMKDLGIQLTEVRVTDSAMTRSVEIRYKALKGLDEADAARANSVGLSCFDEQGKLIGSVFGGSSIKQGDTIVQWEVLPADTSGGITIGTPIWSDDWNETGGENLVRLNLEDAEKVDIESVLSKRRKQLKAEAEKSAKVIADYEREASATPKPRPTAMPEVSATGCEIPVLRDYDTAYAGVRDQLEAIAMPVNQSVKGKSAKLTIDQLAMSEKHILLFYTIKSKNKIQRDEEYSLKGWSAKVAKVPYFDITFDGENPHATERSFGSFLDCEQFWLDDYTVTGWTLAYAFEPSASVPEKSWMTIKARQFGGGLTLDLVVDRTPARNSGVELDMDVMMPLKDYPNLGVTIRHLSMSPIMNVLWTEEDDIGSVGNGSRSFLIRDDRGESLTIAETYARSVDADPEHPKKVQGRVHFIGGLDSKTLTLVPIEPTVSAITSIGNVEHVPLDAPMPYTITYPSGLKIVIHEIDLTTTGLIVRYKTDVPYINHFELVKSEASKYDEDEPAIGSYPLPELEYDTGFWVHRVTWIPKKGAKEGERIPASMLEGLKYLRFDAGDWTPDEERAVVIQVK